MALRWKASIDHFASFRFADPAAGPRAHVRSVRDFAERIHQGLAFPSAQIADPFGDEDMSMFSIAFDASLFGGYEVNVGVFPGGPNPDRLWALQVQVPDAGMREAAWRPKLEMMKVVERGLHARLLELGAMDLRWRLQERRDDPGQATP
ncbi:hypothetical protein ASD21_13155 [Caulobacter sp. Root1455]|jgi:hypothetical protein|uniref:hypothetical protein n=1 Tax=Caulobacter sp. Root1455 TaxID=1736465 RepID=UPI0006F1CE54|nr:hypothetical protein [Caulobacter sp. Root1455]KQY92356.1 hypothetical protein ASD21_13155 [Caulobacter sp. Root1455]